MTAEERGDSRPVARLTAYGRGVVLKSPGENIHRKERTHAGEEGDTDAKQRGIQGDWSLPSVPQSFGVTTISDGDSCTVSDEDNRTPSQRGGPEEKTRGLMPEFNQLSGYERRRHDDGLGCKPSQCRARDTDLLFEMHALRCGISSLNRRFAEMERTTTGRIAPNSQRERSAVVLDRGARTGSGPTSSAMQARICFSCRQPGHMRKQCPLRNQIAGLKAHASPGCAPSPK